MSGNLSVPEHWVSVLPGNGSSLNLASEVVGGLKGWRCTVCQDRNGRAIYMGARFG